MSQAATWGMQTAGPATATAVTGRANASFDALLSSQKGGTAPTYAVGGTHWLDDSVSGAWTVKLYDGAGWSSPLYTYDPVNDRFAWNWHGAAPNVASAATVDLGDVVANYVVITGTTAITSLGTAAFGVYRRVRFAGALTLTHSASLILPDGTNITTAAGDVAELVSEGSGTWRCLSYQRVVTTYTSPEQTIASAAGVGPLAHGLGKRPRSVELSVICKTAEHGYAVGDEVIIGTNHTSLSAGRFWAVVVDATAITIRMSSDTQPLALANKSTGAGALATNANWRLIVRAHV